MFLIVDIYKWSFLREDKGFRDEEWIITQMEHEREIKQEFGDCDVENRG